VGDIPVLEGWKQEVIAIQPQRGHARYLMSVRKERCPSCMHGVRTISLWGTLAGSTEQVAWCAHCFNATCQPVVPEPDAAEQLAALRITVKAGLVSSIWSAVRPALEDLERRGLL
jgi:hypothetical protein